MMWVTKYQKQKYFQNISQKSNQELHQSKTYDMSDDFEHMITLNKCTKFSIQSQNHQVRCMKHLKLWISWV